MLPVAVPEAAELFHEETPHGRADPASGHGFLHEAAHPNVDVARMSVNAGESMEHLLVLRYAENDLVNKVKSVPFHHLAG